MKIRSEKGAAVVEFAVVLPLLLMIVFGIVEFGLILFNQAMITNAAREGARYGILYAEPRHSTAQITSTVNTYLSNYLISFTSGAPPAAATVVKINDVAGDPGTAGLAATVDLLTVEVTYNYDFLILPNFVGGLTGTRTLFASATMRAE